MSAKISRKKSKSKTEKDSSKEEDEFESEEGITSHSFLTVFMPLWLRKHQNRLSENFCKHTYEWVFLKVLKNKNIV